MKRIGLWLSYTVVFFLLSIGFGGGGHGSLAPMAILAAWGIMPCFLGGGLCEFLAGPIIYFAMLFVASGWLVQQHGLRPYGVVPALHLGGIMTAISFVTPGQLATPTFVVCSYVVSIAALVLFFWLDFALLARREAARRK